MENIYWKKSVSTLIGSIWLYTLAGIATSITGVVNAYLNPFGIRGMIMNLMNGESSQEIGMGDVVEKIFSLLVLVGYYLFFRSLTRFMRLQSDTRDREDVARVRIGYILMVVALFVDFIPLIGGLVSFILIIVSYAKMLSGYSGLKRSLTFPSEAREGASVLFSCTIWILIGCILSFIPLIGSIIEGIILLVTFFMILEGWGHIKNGAPNMTSEEEDTFIREEPPRYKQVLGDGLIAIFLLRVLSIILTYATWNAPLLSYTYDYRDNYFYVFFRILMAYWVDLIFVAIYIWLLCSSGAQLKKTGKVGLVLLILGIMIGIYGAFHRLTMGLSNWEGEMLNIAPLCLAIVGMVLFVCGSLTSRAIKITAPLGVLCSMAYFIASPLLYGTFLDIEYYKQLLLTRLVIEMIFFIFICVFVYKWRKRTITVLSENSASLEDHDNTSESSFSEL